MSILSQLRSFFARPAEEKTFSRLIHTITGKRDACMALFLLLPAALPLPTGGITHVLEVAAMGLGVLMIFGYDTIAPSGSFFQRPVLLFAHPKFEEYTMRTVLFFQRWSKWKSSRVMNTTIMGRITGLGVLIFSLAAFVAVPFTGLDTLPALGVVAMAFGLIFEDVGIWICGVIIGCVGTAINLTVLVKLSQTIYDIVINTFS